MKEKIKDILNTMIKNGEFEKIINYEEYSKRERGDVEAYYTAIKNTGLDKIPIIPLIAEMPKSVVQNVLIYLLTYEGKGDK